MADGTLKVGTITNSAGSGNIAIGSGVTLLSNVPAFFAYLSSSQSITDDTITKVQSDTELYDTDNCYDNTTNYRFTPTVAGKYYFTLAVTSNAGAGNLQESNVYLYKNGVAVSRALDNFDNNYANAVITTANIVQEANGTTDYFEMYTLINDTSGNPSVYGESKIATYFGAYRIGA